MNQKKIITRFAPSPTGFLHIGSARTALFNMLYAKHMGGKFLLRIEDTDKVRSTEQAVKAIIEDLKWLGIHWDGEIVLQSQRNERHTEIARQLVELGKAYYCYMTQDEIAEYRIHNPHKKILSPWRENSNSINICTGNVRKGDEGDDITAPSNKPTIRLRMPNEGETIVNDAIHGEVRMDNSQLDDMILLRSDGVPTYMLAVVVDDHDVGVNWVIRGDDHFTNTFRQIQIYRAMNWSVPNYAHIPLIHDMSGGKLSKRNNAVGIDFYRYAGYLPEAICNYLLRLGWGYSEREIWDMVEVVPVFDIYKINKAPARFDIEKLNSLNAHYIHNKPDSELFALLLEYLRTHSHSTYAVSHDNKNINVLLNALLNNKTIQDRVRKAMPQLKLRTKNIADMAKLCGIYIKKQIPQDEKSRTIMLEQTNCNLLRDLMQQFTELTEQNWNAESIQYASELFASSQGVKNTLIMQVLRAGVLGTFESPGIYQTLAIIGKNETLNRAAIL